MEQEEHKLNFSTFNLHQVLQRGDLLLASAGKEFEQDPAASATDAKERLAMQRADLKKRLGLGTEFMDGSSACTPK